METEPDILKSTCPAVILSGFCNQKNKGYNTLSTVVAAPVCFHFSLLANNYFHLALGRETQAVQKNNCRATFSWVKIRPFVFTSCLDPLPASEAL